jgi:hypothetical protein
MNFTYKDEILSLFAFSDIAREMMQQDRQMGENIMTSISSAVVDYGCDLRTCYTKEQAIVALMKQLLTMQAHSSQYLGITEEMNQKKNTLLEYKSPSIHSFLDEIEYEIANFFNQRIKLMWRELEEDSSWYSGLRDSTKKVGGSLINMTLKGINHLAQEMNGREWTKETVDDRTIVEAVLEKHLSIDDVTNHISEIFESATERFKQRWMEKIAANTPNMDKISIYSLANQNQQNLKIDFQLGSSEQVLAMGLGSAVVGTVGLAAGWHTLTYALLNVFPPIAIFAAVLTVATGILTKESAVHQRKMDVEKAVKRYHECLLIQIYSLKLKELGNQKLPVYMDSIADQMIEESMKQWEQMYFGQLTTAHYQHLNQAFVKHLMYINEALSELEAEKGV